MPESDAHMIETSARHARRTTTPVSEWPLWAAWRLCAPLALVVTLLAPVAATVARRPGAPYLTTVTAVVVLAVLSGLIGR
jgi:hypothetical protein